MAHHRTSLVTFFSATLFFVSIKLDAACGNEQQGLQLAVQRYMENKKFNPLAEGWWLRDRKRAEFFVNLSSQEQQERAAFWLTNDVALVLRREVEALHVSPSDHEVLCKSVRAIEVLDTIPRQAHLFSTYEAMVQARSRQKS